MFRVGRIVVGNIEEVENNVIFRDFIVFFGTYI